MSIDWSQIKTAEQLAADAAQQALESARSARAKAFQEEAYPLFFKAQLGEATMGEWRQKMQEIRKRFPYPNDET
jgi:hypothetical protein